MPSVPEWILIQQKAPGIYWAGTAAAVAHPSTRKFGFKMASFGIRATSNVAIGATRALAGTTLVRGGTVTLGRAAGAVGLGYAIGATVGSGISYAIWGKEGAKDAMSFYTSPIDSTMSLFD